MIVVQIYYNIILYTQNVRRGKVSEGRRKNINKKKYGEKEKKK